MYFGWTFCGNDSRSNDMKIVESGFSFLSRSKAICLTIESEIITAEGEKLSDTPEGVGMESVQFKAQHKRVALACGDCSLLFAFLQQLIIRLSIFPEWEGIRANTPPARVKSRNNDVSHLFIFVFTILVESNLCQEQVLFIK